MFFINLLFIFYVSGESGVFYFFGVYFFIQEMLGFLFVFCFRNLFIFTVVLFKANLGWFFYWVVFLVKLLNGYIFFIFNFFLKLLYIPLISKLIEFYSELVLIYSLLLLFIYQLFIKRLKFLFFLNSCETFSSFIIGFFSSHLETVLVFLVYFVLVVQVWSEIENFLDLEKVFYFISLPLNVVFFVKIFIMLFWGEKRIFYLLAIVFSVIRVLSQSEFIFKEINSLVIRNSIIVLSLILMVFLLLYWVII